MRIPQPSTYPVYQSSDIMTDLKPADFAPVEGLLDNTQITTGQYIAHIAVPCRDLEETARWYSEVLGAQPVRILDDRVTSVLAASCSWCVIWSGVRLTHRRVLIRAILV